MEPQGIKRKRSEIQQKEISQLKYSRTVSYICRELENQINSGKSQPRIDTSTMPVNSEKTASSGYELLQRLGEGTFGLWYKARDKQTQQIVAIKKLEPHDNKWDKHYLRHANIGLALSHRHLRRVLEVVARKTDAQSLALRAMLVAEYCDCDLTALIQGARYRDRHLSERHVKSIVHQLLLAVEYMHKNNVMHRDIKPGKIYLKDGEIKLDLSSLLREYTTDGTLSPVVVTLWYRAPELLLGTKEYDFSIDMWSVGCVMAELFMQQPLFSGKSELDMLSHIVRVLGPARPCAWPELADLGPLVSVLLHAPEPQLSLAHIIPQLSRTAHDLLCDLLCYNPRARLTARQALQHEWFNDVSQSHPLQYVMHRSATDLLEWY